MANKKSGKKSSGSRPAPGYSWVNPGEPFSSPKKPSYNGNMLGELNLPAGYGDYVSSLIAGRAPAAGQPGSSLIAPNIGGLVSNVPGRKFDGYAPDSFYNEALSTIAANRRRALDSATEGERELAGDFGLGIVQDEGGARFSGQWAASDPTAGGIDPSNPFSRASLLNKSYFAANKVGEGAYANRGLLTSGAYQRSQQRNAFGFEQGRDQLLRQFASGLQGYRNRRSQAESDAETQRRQSSLDLYGRNRDNYDRMYPS